MRRHSNLETNKVWQWIAEDWGQTRNKMFMRSLENGTTVICVGDCGDYIWSAYPGDSKASLIVRYKQKVLLYSALKKALGTVAEKRLAEGGNMILVDAENIRRLRDACKQQPDKEIVDVAWDIGFGFEVM